MTFPSPVNNAGYVLGMEHVGSIADEDIEGMFATNVLGLISITQLLVQGEWKRWFLLSDMFTSQYQNSKKNELVMSST